MADYAELVLLAQDNREMTVRLTPYSLAVIFSSIGESLERLYKWTGSGEFGGLSDAEKAAVDLMVAKAEKELMTNALIGTIVPYVTTDPPSGTLACDGTQYERVDYPELYALIDSALIVDADHFKTPDLAGKFPLGESFNHAINTTGGTETVTLTEQQIPSHSHSYTGVSPDIDLEDVGVPQVTAASVLPFQTTGSTGGSQSHNNMPPFRVIRWAIWAQ
jgi:microcystin-dependent protein